MTSIRGRVRELTWDMERALACAVIASGSAIEVSMRRQQHNAQLMALDAAPSAVRDAAAIAAQSYQRAAEDTARVRSQARRSLAAGQPDCRFWLATPIAELADRIRSDCGIDPEMIGDRSHDLLWATNADETELPDVYACAIGWRATSLAAEMLATHIAELSSLHGGEVECIGPPHHKDVLPLLDTTRFETQARPTRAAASRSVHRQPAARESLTRIARAEFDLDVTPTEKTGR